MRPECLLAQRCHRPKLRELAGVALLVEADVGQGERGGAGADNQATATVGQLQPSGRVAVARKYVAGVTPVSRRNAATKALVDS